MSILGWITHTKDQFRQSWRELRSVRTIAMLGLLTALDIAVAALDISLTPWLRLQFGFVLRAASGMMFGPTAAALQGLAADLLGFLLHPGGVFFPGYTLSAVLGGVIYGLFLYKVPITWLRALACKATINLCVNIGLGTLWSTILYGRAFWVLFADRAPKNLLLLAAEVPLLLITYGIVQRIERRAR